MLQLEIKTFASDAFEDACRLAQTKALNSYSWSDIVNYLNYTWNDIYNQVALVDEGYYSKTIRLTKKLSKLPACVKNSIKVYAAQTPNRYNREIFRASGYNDLNGWNTYHISGFDIYCPDAERRAVWLNYLPQPPQIFFTINNRDPKLYVDQNNLPEKTLFKIDTDGNRFQLYNLYRITLDELTQEEQNNPNFKDYVMYLLPSDLSGPRKRKLNFHYRNTNAGIPDAIVSSMFAPAYGDKGEWQIVSFICDFPYIFVTYQHSITEEYWSGFYRDCPNDSEFIEYNPFSFTGRNSNVEYYQAKWNDKTGLGVIIYDHNEPDSSKAIKELGWTPDTLLVYPAPEMYRLLVARLADKFAAFNESTIMGVGKELTEAEWAFKNFLGKDKSAWQRIDNVNGPSIGDWL